MGFFDKIKDALKRIKEDNKYIARTTARINSNNLYGYVNYKTGKMDPNDDFRALSYVNVENGKGIIYNTGDEDYVFEPGDIVSFKHIGEGQPLNGGKNTVTGQRIELPSWRFAAEFKDGKKTNIDINLKKLDAFKSIFQL